LHSSYTFPKLRQLFLDGQLRRNAIRQGLATTDGIAHILCNMLHTL
jgi:hypothetical protein